MPARVRECLRGHEREGDGHHHEGEVGTLVEIQGDLGRCREM